MPLAKKTNKSTPKKRLPKLSNSMVVLMAREYYRLIMPRKKTHRVFVWVIFLSASVIISCQMLYPLDRAVPFAQIGDTSVAYMQHDTLAAKLTTLFGATKVELRAGEKTTVHTLATAGAELNTERSIQQLIEYPFWQRFIPLSILWQVPSVSQANVFYTDARLQEFAHKRSAEMSASPTNARLAIEQGKLVATPAKQGIEIRTTDIVTTLSRASLQLGKTTQITLPSKQLAAARTMDDFVQVQAQAEAALQRKITIILDEQHFTPTDEEVASWLLLATEPAGQVSLQVDAQKVETYIASLNAQVGEPAGQTDIRMVNGNEVGHTPGKVGREVDSAALLPQISAYLLEGMGYPNITGSFVEVQPSIIFNSKYTSSEAGLQAYVADVGASKNVRIDVRQLDGQKWSANTRATESTVSASTYKLFVSLVLFDKMSGGEISWSDQMLDTDVSTCFDRMTIASTNPCAEKWLAEWGRSNVNSFLYGRGFSNGTTFTSSIANHTTAADLTTYMTGLHEGTLVKEPYRSRLIHSLSVHPYRKGIPSGSQGKVYDKVGFLWDYVHDTAIVQHPRGTYAITVMTKGQSYAAIATITREIEKIMYP